MIAHLILPVAHAQTAITNDNIAAAVTAWIGGDATTYGNIVNWNTAAVTSMAELFSSKTSFNADISKWNVARVANMHWVCALGLMHTWMNISTRVYL